MEAWLVLLFVAVALAGLAFRKTWLNSRGQAPGPWGIPFLGYLPFLMFSNPFKTFEKMKVKYGKIMSLKLGKFSVVVLQDYKLIQEALSKDALTGRPAFDAVMFRNDKRKGGLIFGEGQKWNEHRRFVIRNLRTFGFGKSEVLDSSLTYEVNEVVQDINKNAVGKTVNLKPKLGAAILNTLWFLCTGSRFASDDPEFQFCFRGFVENVDGLHLTGPTLFSPWMVQKGLLFKGYWSGFKSRSLRIKALVRSFIDEHKQTFDPDAPRDLVDAFLSQCQKTTDPNSSFFGAEGDLNITNDLVDLFVAGASTTSITMQWAILYMISFPDIQRKVQAEIDRVLGNRVPSLDDRGTLLYVEATINEVHRYCSLAPFSIFHSSMETTELQGFTIPKDTVILANLRDAHFDVSYWKDPNTFRPERFIDPVSSKIIRHEPFMPFSHGKRQCFGRDTLFIFFTTLLQKYNFAKDPMGPVELDLQPIATSVLVSPKPYNVAITGRDISGFENSVIENPKKQQYAPLHVERNTRVA